ncbi:MAG TPA: LacI family DNA-binding transcriptional regulator [Anaerolineales bacterium]|nr:LacI family DNA-binding transcriptional regulator [Anaerolineales bacterium]
MPRVTLKDVAEQAGVSFKTVSRVINHEPNVASVTSQKVNKAIADLHYVPNVAARSLSRGKAKAIALVTGWPINHPYTGALIDQCFEESNRNGYSMVLFSLSSGIDRKISDAFLGRQVDGIVMDTKVAEDDELIRQLTAMNVPYVVIHPNRKSGRITASFIQIDNIEATRQAINYLIKLGHRTIGYINPQSGLVHDDERLHGYRLALEEAGIKPCDNWIYSGTTAYFTMALSGTSLLLRNNPEMTAIFAATDDIAMGVVSAVWQMGLKVPDDISVVGFDDITYATMTTPPLTTIHQPIDEIARTAVSHLISLIEDPGTPHIDLVMPTHLVIRDTCRAPRSVPTLVSV